MALPLQVRYGGPLVWLTFGKRISRRHWSITCFLLFSSSTSTTYVQQERPLMVGVTQSIAEFACCRKLRRALDKADVDVGKLTVENNPLFWRWKIDGDESHTHIASSRNIFQPRAAVGDTFIRLLRAFSVQPRGNLPLSTRHWAGEHRVAVALWAVAFVLPSSIAAHWTEGRTFSLEFLRPHCMFRSAAAGCSVLAIWATPNISVGN